jgi:adenylylsulfate kinase
VTPSARVATVLLTGTVGSGKTATAVAIGHALHARGVPSAVIDLDWLGWAYLEPGSLSPDELIALNLAAVWPNYAAAGMRRAVLARGLTSHGALESIRHALPQAEITVVRLTAATETIEARLRRRDSGVELREHIAEAIGMAGIMERLSLETFAVSTDSSSIEAVAAEVIRLLEWAGT